EEAGVPSSLPNIVTNYCALIAKIILQQGQTTMTITYPWTTVFTSSLATDHGSLGGLGDVADHDYALLHNGTRALSGAWDMGSQALTNVNIDSGTVDGTTITAPVLDGTVTNTGATLVMPAFTAGGLISANGYIDMATGTSIRNSLTTGGHWFGLTARDVDGSAWVALARVINANDPYIDFGTAGGALKIYGSNKIELQNTLTLNGQVFDAGSGYGEIDTTGKVGLLMDGGITSGGVAASNCLQNYFGGNFVSGGVGNHAAKLFVGGELLGFENDTGTLSVVRLFGSVKTQDSADDVISVVSQLWLREPTITVQGSTTITVAATLYIDGAPTEGVTDAAIYVASGDTNLATLTMRGALAMGANSITLDANETVDGVDISAHDANTTTAHGAVSAATASKHVVRDASARAKFAAPGASGDALIKGTRVTTAELPAMTDEKIWKGTGANVEEVDVYTDAAALASAVQAGAITNAVTKAPTHDAVFDVKATADGAIAKSLLTTRGDIIYRDASVPARLAKGTNGHVLTMGASDPAWAAAAGGDPGEGHITIVPYAYSAVNQGTWAFSINASQAENYVFQNTSGNDRDELDFKVYLAAGTYTLMFFHYADSGRGIVDFDIDAGEVASFDTYSASPTFNVRSVQTSISIATSGLKTLTMRVDGKNGSASSYVCSATTIVLWRTA
ncbi:hypothetical protein LCGC14_1990500, partial [marine sediment metagenome]